MNQDSKTNKNKGGRKKLPDHLKRKKNNRIDMLFNDEEFSYLINRMKDPYPNFEKDKAFYTRKFLLDGLNESSLSKQKVVNPNDYNNKLTQNIVYSLSKIGNNLNQTTRILHSKKESIDSKTLYHLENNIKNLLEMKSEILTILLNDS